MGGTKAKSLVYLLTSLLFILPSAQASEFTLNYDSNGNLIKLKDYQYEYNGFNQLARVKDLNGQLLTEYYYDEGGNRVKKIDYAKNETTFYASKSFIRIINSSGTYDFVYYYHNGVLVGKKEPDGTKGYYHPNHLGSTDIVTDQDGRVIEKTEYLPFGEVYNGGRDRFLFTGKEKDTETGLYYYGARYYDPYLRQFTQPDTVIQDIYNPQNLNRYSYVLNNPYKYEDDTGESPTLVTAVIGAGVGATIGATSSAAIQYFTTGNVNLAEVGRSAAIGGAAGGVSGATLGVANLAAGGAGLSLGSELGLGAASSLAGGRAATATSNVLQGNEWSENLLSPASIATDVVIGGATAGAVRGFKTYYIGKSWGAGGASNPYENMLDHWERTNPAGYNPYRFTVEADGFKANLGQSGYDSLYTQVGKKYPEVSTYISKNMRYEPGFKVVYPDNEELVIIDSYDKIYSYHSPK